MTDGPVIIRKGMDENVAGENVLETYTFFHQNRKAIMEELGRCEIILILHNIIDDDLSRSYLIISNSVINCISVVKSVTRFLSDFMFVEERVFGIEVLRVILVDKAFYIVSIESKDGYHWNQV